MPNNLTNQGIICGVFWRKNCSRDFAAHVYVRMQVHIYVHFHSLLFTAYLCFFLVFFFFFFFWQHGFGVTYTIAWLTRVKGGTSTVGWLRRKRKGKRKRKHTLVPSHVYACAAPLWHNTYVTYVHIICTSLHSNICARLLCLPKSLQ
ncbi:hypothetical protein PVIIG_02399 [Plasmodium vivax India VII]|uniref:Uncharacterized protein n=1 Tax=Plasmodium vivax India VII TaxID=1077284 RepID=A0A0J9SHX4_PLAVI|nr:hypothetical protein PVIIG_02399 [Plasmodium vivax India VII]